MKIYIVLTDVPYEASDIFVAAFSTKEKAEEFMKSHGNKWNSYYLATSEVDPVYDSNTYHLLEYVD